MKNKHITRVLWSKRVPAGDVEVELQLIAQRHGAQFHVSRRTGWSDPASYFVVPGKSDTKRVENKKVAIAKSLFDAGLGDEGGDLPS